MEHSATENLFLLEFLVDSVNLYPNCPSETLAGETCVSFQFLDNAPLNVCEADFNPNRNIQNDASDIKSGKSCLFSLSPEQIVAAKEQFDIHVSVLKRLQPKFLPETIEIVDVSKDVHLDPEDTRPHLEMQLFGKTIIALIDTGAVGSYKENSTRTLCQNNYLHPTKPRAPYARSANGQETYISETYAVPLQIGPIQCTEHVSYFPGMDHDLLIGMDILSRHPFTIDFRTGQIHLDNSIHPDARSQSGIGIHLHLQDTTITIKPVTCGVTSISISNLFNELIESIKQTDSENSPTAKTLKDEFDITDSNSPNPNTNIGKIAVYIRISCFGKLIVTQFQMNLTDKSVLFKDKEGKSLYRYKKSEKKEKEGGSCQKSGKKYNADCPSAPCNTPDEQHAEEQIFTTGFISSDCPVTPNFETPYLMNGGVTTLGYGRSLTSPAGAFTNTFSIPCNECGYVTNPTCAPPMAPAGGLGMQQIYEYDNRMGPVFSAGNYGIGGGGASCGGGGGPVKNYQEIGASMGGNSLTIRVHKDKNKIEQLNGGVDDTCIWDLGNNGGGTAMVPHHQNYAMNQQAFAMRPGVPANSPFMFRMGQYGDMAPMEPDGRLKTGGNNVLVNPPVFTGSDGTQFAEFSDPNKEMFILRIGKKNEGADKKNNLELELQTPRAPPLKPIPKKETVETQYEVIDLGSAKRADSDAGKVEKKAVKAKKDKGGKGGKGKKKKK